MRQRARQSFIFPTGPWIAGITHCNVHASKWKETNQCVSVCVWCRFPPSSSVNVLYNSQMSLCSTDTAPLLDLSDRWWFQMIITVNARPFLWIFFTLPGHVCLWAKEPTDYCLILIQNDLAIACRTVPTLHYLMASFNSVTPKSCFTCMQWWQVIVLERVHTFFTIPLWSLHKIDLILNRAWSVNKPFDLYKVCKWTWRLFGCSCKYGVQTINQPEILFYNYTCI